MNKSSATYLFECYIWLVNTIARGPISRTNIDDKWARASINDYKKDSIPESTFHRWRAAAESLFDITIKCNSLGEYYIENKDIVLEELSLVEKEENGMSNKGVKTIIKTFLNRIFK